MFKFSPNFLIFSPHFPRCSLILEVFLRILPIGPGFFPKSSIFPCGHHQGIIPEYLTPAACVTIVPFVPQNNFGTRASVHLYQAVI